MTEHKISWKDARAVAVMYDIHEKNKGGACEPIGNWLVKRAKKTWPRFAGLKGPSKTNGKRQWTLMSYHHPAQLCWLWAVWFTLCPTDGHWWQLWGGYRHQKWVGAKYLFRISLHRQPGYAWMLSSIARMRLQEIARHVDPEYSRQEKPSAS